MPRSAHGAWAPSPGRPDPVGLLAEQAATRVAELIPIRYGRMVASPFSFYRGEAAIMAADLADTPRTGLEVQLCGDAHLSNFGALAAPDRRLVFSINDFDETLPGPVDWDVKRLIASFAVDPGSGLASPASQHLVDVEPRVPQVHGAHRGERLRRLAVRLRRELDSPSSGGSEVPFATGDRGFQRARSKAESKDSLRALTKLTHIVDGRLEELFGADEAARFADIARKVVGVGSVGTRAWVVLMLGRDDDPLLLQFKEAQSSCSSRTSAPAPTATTVAGWSKDSG